MALSRYEKKGLTISLVIITLVATFFPMLILADEEYNYKIKKNGWEYTFRHREGGKHIEIGNRIGPIEIMYRYADLRLTQENRIKFTGEFFSYKDLVFEGRIEYRHFNNKESHWRYRFIAEYTPHLYGPFYLYAKWQPRWSFKKYRTKFDARDQLGITYKEANWKVTPFIERKSTERYARKMTVTGIHWEVKL